MEGNESYKTNQVNKMYKEKIVYNNENTSKKE